MIGHSFPPFRVLSLGLAFGGLAAACSSARAGLAVASNDVAMPFASAPAGATKADSVAADGPNIFIGFGNGGAPDGSDGGSSTIAQYTTAGALVQTFSVPGHNDGLRVDPSTHLLWAVQNEDGNAQLQVINTTTGTKTGYAFSSAAHGGGYDDLVFRNGQAFFTASNPATDANNVVIGGPAVVSGVLSGNQVVVTPALQNNGTASNLLTGKTVQLNLTDPDSMTVTPKGDLMFVSQADNQLIFIHDPGAAGQTVSQLPLTDPTGAAASVDDSMFVPAAGGRAILSDGGSLYALDIPSSASGIVLSADTDTKTLDELNTSTGVLTPLITGLSGPKGLVLLPSAVPLPNAMCMGLAGLLAMVAVHAVRRKYCPC